MLSLGVSQRFLGHHRTAQLDAEQSNRILATGKRVNDFSDDAGAASLASRMNVRSVGLRQATRNIDEAINAATMTDDGMQDVHNLLSRMRELAVQSANGILSDDDRTKAQKEFFDLRTELNRHSTVTHYNDTIQLLANESLMQIGFVIDTSGSMGGEISNLINGILNGTSTFAQLLSGIDYNGEFALSILSGDTDGARTTVNFADTASFTSALTSMPGAVSGMDPFAALVQVLGYDNSTASSNSPDDNFGFNPNAQKTIILVTDTGRESDQLTSTDVPSETATAIGQLVNDSDVTLHVMGGSSFFSTMAAQTGGTHQGMASDGSNVSTLLDNIFDAVVQQAEEESFGKRTNIQAGEDSFDQLKAQVSGFTLPSQLKINLLDISTQAGADTAIGSLDIAIDNVLSQRAEVGAATQQLIAEREHVVNEYTAMDSTSATIEDADMAQSSVDVVNNSMKSDTAIQSMRKWFQFRAEQLESLLT